MMNVEYRGLDYASIFGHSTFLYSRLLFREHSLRWSCPISQYRKDWKHEVSDSQARKKG
jgi:hypothetical protein